MKNSFIAILIAISFFSVSCKKEVFEKTNNNSSLQMESSGNELIDNGNNNLIINNDIDLPIVIVTELNFESFIAPVRERFIQDSVFVDSFIDKYLNGTLETSDYLSMLSFLNITTTTDFSELKLALERDKVLDTTVGISNDKNAYCNRLVTVRNAMLDECNNYVWGLDQVCSGAVMAAYWYHSDGC